MLEAEGSGTGVALCLSPPPSYEESNRKSNGG